MDSLEKLLFGKVLNLAIWEKTNRVVTMRFYGYTLGVLLFCGLAFFALYPAMTHAEDSVIFLSTTYPAVESVVVEEQPQIAIGVPVVEDSEQRLVEMLMKDDIQVAHDTMDNKESWQLVRMRVTGYCSCPKCCGKYSDGKTASSHRIRRGDVFVAADKHYRFGTEMVIPGYNHARAVEVLDRGRVIKGNRLDLYFDSHQKAKKWGVKYLDVLVKTN